MWLLEPDSLVNIAHLSKIMFGGPWSGRPPPATIPTVAFGRRSPWLTASIQGVPIKTSRGRPFVLVERRYRL
jgi:hypothetical protein